MQWIDAIRAQFRFIPRWNSVYEAVSVEIKIRAVYCGSQQNTAALCQSIQDARAHVVRNLMLLAEALY
jgi:hypothetical protein